MIVENPSDVSRVKKALDGAASSGSLAGGGVVVKPVPGRLRAEDEEQ